MILNPNFTKESAFSLRTGSQLRDGGSSLLQPNQHIDSYVVVRHLADGGTSEVYLVQPAHSAVEDDAGSKEAAEHGPYLALKILKESHAALPALQARFLNEAVALESLSLDGVVSVFSNGDYAGRPYFVMEYLPHSLAERLTSPLPLSEVLQLGTRLSQTLAALHSRGFVHRDIKPQNILFTQSGELRLLDFSHALLPEHSDSLIPHSTETGAFLGTRDYAAPEQLLNAKSVDGRADVYALGIVLVEALLGHHPFAHLPADERSQARLTRDAGALLSFPLSTPPKLTLLLTRMLGRTPKKRPSAQEVAAQLAVIPSHHTPKLRWGQLAPLLLVCLCPALPDPTLRDFDMILDLQSLQDVSDLLAKVQHLKQSPKDSARLCQKQADLARELGDLESSKLKYESALQLFSQHGMDKETADSATRLADMMIHYGPNKKFANPYQASVDLYKRAEHAREKIDEEGSPGRFYFSAYHKGLLALEQKNYAEASEHFRRAVGLVKDKHRLWQARTEERLASLPDEPNQPSPLKWASDAQKHIAAHLKEHPEGQLARWVELRIKLRLAVLKKDSDSEHRTWQQLRSVWQQDTRRGIWAHEYLDLLWEAVERAPQRRDLLDAAKEVVVEVQKQSQWQGDVHIQKWQQKLSS